VVVVQYSSLYIALLTHDYVRLLTDTLGGTVTFHA